MKSIEDMRKVDAPLVIADHEGIIQEVNRRFGEVYGWKQEELVGESLSRILPATFRDAHHLGFSRFQITETSQILDHPLRLMTVCRDGSEIESEHFIVAEKSGDRWLFAATLRPLV